MSKIKKLFYHGKFTEFSEASQEGEDLIKEAELFSTGTHRGTEYTTQDLTTLSENFTAEESIPIQLDHSESVKDTVGFLEEARVEEGKLLGRVRIVDESAKEKIGKKLANKLSVSFYTDKQGRPQKLREVSLVAFPQVRSARLFSENGFTSEVEEFEEETKEVEKPMPENTNEFVSHEQFQAINVQYAELTEKFKQLEAQNKSFSEGQIDLKVEKFQESNKIVPAQGESLKKLLASFSEEQTTLFEEFMSNAQKADFNETAEVEAGEKPQDAAQKEFDKFEEDYQAYLKSVGQAN